MKLLRHPSNNRNNISIINSFRLILVLILFYVAIAFLAIFSSCAWSRHLLLIYWPGKNELCCPIIERWSLFITVFVSKCWYFHFVFNKLLVSFMLVSVILWFHYFLHILTLFAAFVVFFCCCCLNSIFCLFSNLFLSSVYSSYCHHDRIYSRFVEPTKMFKIINNVFASDELDYNNSYQKKGQLSLPIKKNHCKKNPS